jgi:hypothetical protein
MKIGDKKRYGVETDSRTTIYRGREIHIPPVIWRLGKEHGVHGIPLQGSVLLQHTHIACTTGTRQAIWLPDTVS